MKQKLDNVLNKPCAILTHHANWATTHDSSVSNRNWFTLRNVVKKGLSPVVCSSSANSRRSRIVDKTDKTLTKTSTETPNISLWILEKDSTPADTPIVLVFKYRIWSRYVRKGKIARDDHGKGHGPNRDCTTEKGTIEKCKNKKQPTICMELPYQTTLCSREIAIKMTIDMAKKSEG